MAVMIDLRKVMRLQVTSYEMKSYERSADDD